MAGNILSNNNIHGKSQFSDVSQLGNCSSVLDNPHGISLGSEGSDLMEEGEVDIINYPGVRLRQFVVI